MANGKEAKAPSFCAIGFWDIKNCVYFNWETGEELKLMRQLSRDI